MKLTMKTSVLLALTVLHLCSILRVSSGATLSREMPVSKNLESPDTISKAYKSLLENMLREASKQIAENAAFDENMDLERFDQENIFDDEQSVILTEEEQGFAADDQRSSAEDNHFADNVGSGLSCSWRGLSGRCCQSLKVIKFKMNICLVIEVSHQAAVQLSLVMNGKNIWSKNVGFHEKSLNVCIKHPFKICFTLDNLQISKHYIKICIKISARLLRIKFHKNLGCISKKFALNEILTITNKTDSFNVHDKRKDVLPPRGNVYNNNVVIFEQ